MSITLKKSNLTVGIVSGAPGSGKTTVAVNLAVAIGTKTRLLDCAVEQPITHLSLQPQISGSSEVFLEIPQIDFNRCTFCGCCENVCEFGALSISLESSTARIYEDLCRACGKCRSVCSQKAIFPGKKLMGQTSWGHRGSLDYIQGRLTPGERGASSMVRYVRSLAQPGGITIINAPAGNASPMVAALKGADLAVAVADPTPFGLNGFEQVLPVLRGLGLPVGVVVNQGQFGDRRIHRFAHEHVIPILLEIPHERQVAEDSARGRLPAETMHGYRELMLNLMSRISLWSRSFSN